MNSAVKKSIELQAAPSRADNETFLRVGIIGAGLMGKWHARAALKAGGNIVALADSESDTAKILTAKYPSAQIFDNLEEMLERQALDILHICTPTGSHCRIAELAIKSGVSVLVEKPLAVSAQETIFLYDLAKSNNVKLCPTHQFAFQKSVEKAKKLVSAIGDVIHLKAIICSAGGAGHSAGKLNEIAADILPHPLSLFQSFLNNPLDKESFSSFQPQDGELRINGRAEKISLEIFISLNVRPTINSFQIFGSEGSIHLDLFHDFTFMENGKVSKLRKIIRPFDFSARNFSAAFFNLLRRSASFETAYPGLQNLVIRFYQSVRENKETPISGEQVINIAQIRDKLIAATLEKEPEK